MDHHVDHAVVEQVFGPLEAFRQSLADGLFDDPGAGEPDHRAGLGDGDVAEHGKGRRHAAGGGIAKHHDIGQAGLSHLIDGDGGARHLHQRQNAFLHARPTRRRNGDQRRALNHGQACRRQDAFADRHAHGAAHELEIERRDHDADTTHGAMGNGQGIGGTGFHLGVLEAFGIALAVAELKRVDDGLGKLNDVIGAVVEQHLETNRRRQAHVVAAMVTDLERLLQIAMEDHFAAARALVPQVVGDLFLADKFPELGTDEIG